MTQPTDPPSAGSDNTLNVAAWHLQVLLTSLSGFDGKIMFLTALNVAGISALIGIAIAADPIDWLFGLSLVLSALGVTIGVSRLWSAGTGQFPTPDEVLSFVRASQAESSALDWKHFGAIRDATAEVNATLQRVVRLVRALLLLTLVSFAFVIATALWAVY